ncbi:MAG: hypothetical protein LBH93_08395, partial [Chitinispirillales bacterium]|nr:hypothetical protein [Chitinispirillales bacterium]
VLDRVIVQSMAGLAGLAQAAVANAENNNQSEVDKAELTELTDKIEKIGKADKDQEVMMAKMLSLIREEFNMMENKMDLLSQRIDDMEMRQL